MSTRRIQAVDRAAMLLKATAASRTPASVLELAETCEINRSTAWRLLATLEHHGLVERDPLTRRYRLGYGALALGTTAREQGALVRRMRPRLERLADDVKETVNLSIGTPSAVVCVDQVNGPQVVTLNWLGRPLPLHCSSNGKVLLAWCSELEREAYLRQPLERFSQCTVTDPDQLRAELELARERGYAIACGEFEEGFNGVSAPVLDAGGRPIAFVSISGVGSRMSRKRLEVLGVQALRAARDMGETAGAGRRVEAA